MKLVRDTNGYESTPHTDSSERWVSTIFYLPKESVFEDFGTVVLKDAEQRRHGAGETNTWPGFKVCGLGFRVQGSGFRVQGLGFRV